MPTMTLSGPSNVIRVARLACRRLGISCDCDSEAPFAWTRDTAKGRKSPSPNRYVNEKGQVRYFKTPPKGQEVAPAEQPAQPPQPQQEEKPKGPPTVAEAKAMIQGLRHDDPELGQKVKDLAAVLGGGGLRGKGMLVKDLLALKSELGISASGVKSELAKKIIERGVAKSKTATPETPPPESQQVHPKVTEASERADGHRQEWEELRGQREELRNSLAEVESKMADHSEHRHDAEEQARDYGEMVAPTEPEPAAEPEPDSEEKTDPQALNPIRDAISSDVDVARGLLQVVVESGRSSGASDEEIQEAEQVLASMDDDEAKQSAMAVYTDVVEPTMRESLEGFNRDLPKTSQFLKDRGLWPDGQVVATTPTEGSARLAGFPDGRPGQTDPRTRRGGD